MFKIYEHMPPYDTPVLITPYFKVYLDPRLNFYWTSPLGVLYGRVNNSIADYYTERSRTDV